MTETTTTVDQAEVERFSTMAAEWWNPAGKFRPLHKFNPVRLQYIKEKVCERFGHDINDPQALKGLRLLDIGCGGGLLAEPMARLGAEVVGVDASPVNIEVASIHARQTDLEIDYRAMTAEELQATGETFNIILNMEVVEHVADVALFLRACAKMVRPGGLVFVATINRTPIAYALAIVAAEQILRWLPKGTHSYDKLVRPEEVERPLVAENLTVLDRTGVFYNPLSDRWMRSQTMEVNYMILAGQDG